MKKFLLSLLCLVMFATVANAEEVTVTTSALGYANAAEVTSVKADDVITFTFAKGSNSNAPKYYTSGSAIRFYGGNTLAISAADGYDITNVVFTTGTGSYVLNANSTVSAGELKIDGTTGTWAGKANTFTLTQGGTSGHARLVKIVVTYEGGAVQTVAKPVIAMGENNTVVITTEEGAEAHYTIDGTEPTATSTLYTAPIAITAKTTVKAVAVKGADVSRVTEFVAVPNVVADIAAFIANANPADTKINAPLTVIYQNGRNLYIKDAKEGYILAYNNNDIASIAGAYKNGDVVASMTGAYKAQNGLPELIPSAVGEKTAGTAVEPEEFGLDELSTSLLNHYVKVSGLTITADERANNYTATDADGNKITIYNTFYNANYYDAVEVPEGTDMTVIGFVSCYNTTLQISPVSVQGKALEHVATPVFTPASGLVNAGTRVTIVTETEGAQIHYTVDGSEPTATSELYSGAITINEITTVKAIAVKEGMLDSEVATATYLIKNSDAQTATFDFNKPETLSPVVETPALGKGTNLGDVTLANNGITLTFAQGENQNNQPVIWNPTGSTEGQIEGRIYEGNTMTFTASGAKIASIIFTQFANSTNWAGFNSDLESKSDKIGNSYIFTVGNPASTITFTSVKTSRFAQIDVIYVPDSTTGIDNVEVADDNAPAEYYNLQGVRVANPQGGIFIKCQGGKATKVLVK